MRKRKTYRVEPIFEEYNPELDVHFDGRPLKRRNIVKKAKNISISAFILITIAMVGGFFYTWYTGRDVSVIETDITTKTAAATDLFSTPPQQRDDVSVGVSVQSLSSPVKPGSTATMSIKTNTKVKCSIEAVYDKVKAEDLGLLPKQADEYGTVTWTWLVPSKTPIGKWPITVTCANSVKSGVAGDTLVVSNSI